MCSLQSIFSPAQILISKLLKPLILALYDHQSYIYALVWLIWNSMWNLARFMAGIWSKRRKLLLFVVYQNTFHIVVIYGDALSKEMSFSLQNSGFLKEILLYKV